MRYYVIAGEASGDLHGSNLLRALRQLDPRAEFRAWGGERMEQAGAVLVHSIRELAFMGFWEVAVNLPRILGLLGEARRDIAAWKPDALILIDYPGFNLRMAAHARKLGIPVFWYISPQVWAWKAGRVHKLKERVTRLYAILPFEPAFYARYGMDVQYVGHPLLDALDSGGRGAEGMAAGVPASGMTAEASAGSPAADANQTETAALSALYASPAGVQVALLPGSRHQEVRRLLPVMLEVARQRPGTGFVLAGLSQLGEDFYRSFPLPANVRLALDETYAVLEASQAALVTSGTATLETALLGVPEVVLYRGSPLSYALARRLVRVPYICLVNLILDRPLVTELLQGDAEPGRAGAELDRLLSDPDQRASIQAGYRQLREILGGPGASSRVARDMTQVLGLANNQAQP
jgi:lipid-A-disaccharide synthase